ncbi:unnamed protein product, partial [Rhizoctonia solani]
MWIFRPSMRILPRIRMQTPVSASTKLSKARIKGADSGMQRIGTSGFHRGMSTTSRTGEDYRSIHGEDSRNQTENTSGPVPEQDTSSKSESMGPNSDTGTDLSHEELYKLGWSRCEQFRRFGELDDIEKAIEYGTLALGSTPEDHPDWPRRLEDLGIFYNERFERLGELEDLEKAIEYQSRALADQNSPPEIAMRILGVWLAADNRKTKRSELKKFTPKIHGIKSTYSEHEERHWAYMRMRRSDERLASFVDALNASPKFTVLAQHNSKPMPTHIYVPAKECDSWVSRVRSGTTPVARRSARWTTSTVFRMEIFEYFHKRTPEVKAGLTYIDETDILDVVVMDNANGEWVTFLQSVGDTLLAACDYSSLD